MVDERLVGLVHNLLLLQVSTDLHHQSINQLCFELCQLQDSRPNQFVWLIRWTLKPEFGEVPQYLIKNKKQIAEEKASVEEHIRLRQQQV